MLLKQFFWERRVNNKLVATSNHFAASNLLPKQHSANSNPQAYTGILEDMRNILILVYVTV